MCGICGVIGQRENQAKTLVNAMLQSLVPRGPDGEGVFYAPGIALGSRRLSIIDIEHGEQPLYNEDRSLVLIANAEIYNYVEIRRALESQGHRFRTGSDCEVILHLYEEYGVDCIPRLRGMFAFALFDSRRGVVLLARDRLGEKPLYIYQDESALYFASELKALIRSGSVLLQIDYNALHEYFHYQYVPEPETIIKKVRNLPAGHALLAHIGDRSLTEWTYWSLEDVETVDANPAEVLATELCKIGQIIVRADTDIGVALSGGLDSTAVSALAAANTRSVTAFSIGYEGRPTVDERRFAERVAKTLGLEHHQAELTSDSIVADFDNMVTALDQPIADMASFGYYAIAKLARSHGIKVLLHGHGGDEFFWGYKWVRRALASLRNRDPSTIGRHDLYAYSEIVNMARRLLPGLYTPEFARWQLPYQERGSSQRKLGIRVTRLLADTYLRTNGVAQTERLSMSMGVEVRLPLLDYRFVELVIGLRVLRDDDDLFPKTWLRQATSSLVPDFVSKRNKRPFSTPIQRWHQHLFTAYHERVINGWLVSSGVVTRNGAARLASGACGVGNGTSLSLKALVFETWLHSLSR
ncbi:asparagine synthase (glutamine-hydrolyzing) [Nostoc sp. CHAB 5784]|uniref:asparagine synthase (glutamine-hydrolyzing) n=1 Tax=Nostoc mirabile TaxID=2907820 RepID=UPI001E3F7E2A|nr:asparagine synthase (glutamine-hydrolyzing) [Nostoc mirabile]MCC5669496.1 asparagine synthase (glutamine-hydrolyzing) [Nostoc mirabile CHAB5784]